MLMRWLLLGAVVAAATVAVVAVVAKSYRCPRLTLLRIHILLLSALAVRNRRTFQPATTGEIPRLPDTPQMAVVLVEDRQTQATLVEAVAVAVTRVEVSVVEPPRRHRRAWATMAATVAGVERMPAAAAVPVRPERLQPRQALVMAVTAMKAALAAPQPIMVAVAAGGPAQGRALLLQPVVLVVGAMAEINPLSLRSLPRQANQTQAVVVAAA